MTLDQILDALDRNHAAMNRDISVYSEAAACIRRLAKTVGAGDTAISQLEQAVAALEAENATFRGLLLELTDDEPCSYDHHGYCQTHWLHERPCPNERVRALLNQEPQE